MIRNRIIEIFEHQQIFIDNKEVYKHPIETTDDKLLIKLLYIEFYNYLTTIDKEKDCVYGVQFFRYDKKDRFISSKRWTPKYEIHIFSDLCFTDIREIFRLIGYKLRYISFNRHFEVSKYELVPYKRKLKYILQAKIIY